MKACARHRWGDDSVAGKTIAIQGCGNVGYYLADYLHHDGATLIVTDIDPEKVNRVVAAFRAVAVAPEAIYGARADIFAPCALGGIINDQTLPQLRPEIIAGGANNQLAEERHGDMLEERGITYAPDYVINAGGLVNVNAELQGWTMERARNKAGEIFHDPDGVRHRQGRGDPELSSGGSARRAKFGHRKSETELCLRRYRLSAIGYQLSGKDRG
jgi:leucine dehydrogenase